MWWCYIAAFLLTIVKSHDVCYGSGSDMMVRYPSATLTPGNAGWILTVEDTSKPPGLKWISDGITYFSWFMMNPDAQNPDLINMLIINAKGDSDLTNATVIESYLAPQPVAGTGFNRYCVFLYTYMKPISYTKPKSRSNWNATQFQQLLRSHGAELQDSTYFKVQNN